MSLENSSQQKNSIFISYSRQNSKFVERLNLQLKAQNHPTWLDSEQIQIADRWSKAIRDGIDGMDVFVCFVSQDSLKSQVCHLEIAHAIYRNKRIIPVIINPDITASHAQIELDSIPSPDEEQTVKNWTDAHEPDSQIPYISRSFSERASDNWRDLKKINWLMMPEHSDQHNPEAFADSFLQLIEAVEADPDYIKEHTRLLTRATAWESNAYKSGFVLNRNELKGAEEWLRASANKKPSPTELHTRYIIASRRQVQRNLRNAAGVAILVLLGFIIALAILYFQSELNRVTAENNAATAIAAEQTSAANLFQAWSNDAGRLAQLSRQAFEGGYTRQAILLALEGLTHFREGAYLPENYHTLLAAMQRPGIEHLYLPHEDSVEGTIWNRSETQILTWSRDYTVRVWDTLTGSQLIELAHDNEVTGAQWNRAETRILTWSRDYTVRLWDAVTGDSLGIFSHQAEVRGAVWNVDETRLLTWTEAGKTNVWDIAHQRVLLTVTHQDRVEGATWQSEDRILTWSRDGTAQLWNAITGEPLYTLLHDGAVVGAQWNQDDQRITTWSQDGTVKIWATARIDTDGVVLMQTLKHSSPVNGVVWNKVGTRVLTWSQGGIVRIWNVENGSEEIFLQHSDSVTGAAWNQGETRVLTWSHDKSARVWNAATGREMLVLTHQAWVEGAKWNPAETDIITWGVDDVAHIWDSSDGQLQYSVDHQDDLNGAQWNQDGRFILTWSKDGTARVWDTTSAGTIFQFSHAGAVEGAILNQDETRLLSWSHDGTARVWEIEQKNESLIFLHLAGVQGAIWSADESRLLTWTQDGTATVWNAENGERVLELAHGQAIGGASWNSAQDEIMTWGQDGFARVWDARTGTGSIALSHPGPVTAAFWNPDETFIITIINNSMWMWNPKLGNRLRYERNLQGTVWSADKTRLLTWRTDGTAKVWDTASGLKTASLVQPGVIVGAVWNADGSRLMTWTIDGTAQVWDITSGEQLLVFPHTGEQIRFAQWSEDAANLLIGTDRGNVRLWNANSGDLVALLIHDSAVRGAEWNGDQTFLLTWTDDDTLWLWDMRDSTVQDGTALLQFKVTGLREAVWNRNGDYLLVGSDTGVIQGWAFDMSLLIEQAQRYSLRPLTQMERQAYFLSPSGTPSLSNTLQATATGTSP